MNNALVIARRELRSYFDSPVAYIVVTAFLLVAGWMYFGALGIMGAVWLYHLVTPEKWAFLLEPQRDKLQTALFSAQDTLVTTQLARLEADVSLYQALGGGWDQKTSDANYKDQLEWWPL